MSINLLRRSAQRVGEENDSVARAPRKYHFATPSATSRHRLYKTTKMLCYKRKSAPRTPDHRARAGVREMDNAELIRCPIA